MTFDQSPHAALHRIIRQARNLLISFEGPIRSTNEGNLPAPHINDVLTACRDSGRSAAIVTTTPLAEVRAYLDAHNLAPYSTDITSTIAEALIVLDASPIECAFVTSSADDTEAAQAEGVPAIAYVKTPDYANHLLTAGAKAFVYSMMDLALSLRAQSLS